MMELIEHRKKSNTEYVELNSPDKTYNNINSHSDIPLPPPRYKVNHHKHSHHALIVL
jgi:hypothetical protein